MNSTRPRRRLRSLIIFVVILACLGFAADRVAESLAEDRLATLARDEAAQYDVRAARTSVEIGGFGFLPQLARSEFSEITLSMDQPSIASIPAEDLNAELTGIHVPRELLTGSTSAPVTIDAANLTLRLSPGALTKLAVSTSGLRSLTLRIVDGKLRARLEIRGLEAEATVRPQAVNGRIGLAVESLSTDLPPPIREALTALLAKGFAVPDLPFNATVKEVAIDNQSVLVTATATSLTLRPS